MKIDIFNRFQVIKDYVSYKKNIKLQSLYYYKKFKVVDNNKNIIINIPDNLKGEKCIFWKYKKYNEITSVKSLSFNIYKNNNSMLIDEYIDGNYFLSFTTYRDDLFTILNDNIYYFNFKYLNNIKIDEQLKLNHNQDEDFDEIEIIICDNSIIDILKELKELK